jgi:hypothetical protein
VDATEEGDADGERGLLDGLRVEAQEGREEDVEEERGGGGVRREGGDGGPRAGDAGVQEGVEVGGGPPAGDEAGADEVADVGEGGELGGVLGQHDEAWGVVAQGGGEEVGVDLDLGEGVEGEAGVEGGDAGVEERAGGDEVGGVGVG